MGAITTVLRLFGSGLRHCLFLILMALRVPVILILRGLGTMLLVFSPFLAAIIYGAGLMDATEPARGLGISTAIACPVFALVCLFSASGYDRLIFALQPRGTELFLPR